MVIAGLGIRYADRRIGEGGYGRRISRFFLWENELVKFIFIDGEGDSDAIFFSRSSKLLFILFFRDFERKVRDRME